MDFEFEGGVPKVPPQKSIFVNVLAWIFIVLCGFGTFIAILQNIMIHTVFPLDEMNQAMQQADQSQPIPPFAEFMFNNFQWFFLAFLIVAATALISAIALLKRKNWARIVFIALMSLGIAWNILGLVMQFTFFDSMPEFPAGEGPPEEFERMMQIMKIASVLMVLALSALYGFVIKKLSSKRIKEEFS